MPNSAKKTTSKKTKKTATTSGKSLLIVESPAKAKAIAKYLGKKFTVKASVGHVKDLPVNKFGIDLENDYLPQYVTIKGKGNFLKEIKKLSKTVDNIYLAPDPDREGEVIAWHIANEIPKNTCNIYRVLFNEITPSAVKYATENPGQIDIDKVNAQQARRVLDRMVGYKISPLLWKKIRMGLSAGRVQSVAVRLICDRQEEIDAFIPKEYWSITSSLKHNNTEFTAKLTSKNGQEIEINNEKETNAILSAIDNTAFRVANVEKKEKKRRPVAPFITSKLQQDAARKLKFSSKKTMLIAQQLYEGIEIGTEGPIGLITYMRTDSTRLSEDSIKEARKIIKDSFGNQYLPASATFYKNRKGAQDAHEAIRPTYPDKKPDEIQQSLTNDQYRLYKLIWNRFIASQVKPAVFNVMSVDIANNDYTFRATGSAIKFDGFMRVYTEGTDSTADAKEASATDKMLPSMNSGEDLECDTVIPKQHFTQPPPRFNEPLLIKVLEEEGIGRPSTYANIISTIQARTYVEIEEGRFKPSELGKMVNDMLVKFFPDVLNIKFTAQLEEKLDLIEDGEANWVNVIDGFYRGFSQTLEKAKVEMKDLKKEEIATDITCEKCSKYMVIKWGKNGKFLGCSGYPDCKNTQEYEMDQDGSIKIVKKETETDEKCNKCGKPMMLKIGRFGKFLACSGYPECKNTKGISIGITCPEPDCTGELYEKKTKRGKTFFSCSRYPDCKFATWDKPVKKACPDCDASFLVEKSASGKLACIQSGCGYKE